MSASSSVSMTEVEKTTNWYDIVGCSVNSTKKEIEKAVRKLSLKYHSDKTNDLDAPEKFLLVQKAKEILLDDTKRKEIDDLINVKLKRKHHDEQRMKEMNESRKKMKEKLEQNLKDLQNTKQPGPTATSTAQSSKSKEVDVEKLRRESMKRMEDMSEKATKN